MNQGNVNLRIGQNVDIKRSDGRVHNAVVTNITWETHSVTVEWFERGETKGKEVEIEQLIALNPVINEVPAASLTRQHNSFDNGTTSVQASVVKDRKTKQQYDRRSVMPAGTPKMQPAVPKQISDAVPAKTSRQQGPSTVQQQHYTAAAANAVDFNGHSPDENDPGFGRANGKDDLGMPNTVKRQSQTVKEIERLEKNRKERRARQEEMRKERQELVEQLEPGNPNWEFLQYIIEFREGLDIRPLQMSDPIEDHQISVCVRKRPMNKRETGKKDIDVLTVPSRDHVIVHEPKTKVDLTKYLENQTFRFDYAFDEDSTNEMVYRFTAQPLVKTIFDGGFATCFAYGQTGSGKTHTMGGDFNGKTQDCRKGIYAFAARDVFKNLNKNYKRDNFVVSCSFFEIYSGKVFDLLGQKNKLRILEDGKGQVQICGLTTKRGFYVKSKVQICGLTETQVDSDEDVLRLIQKGSEIRTAGQTSANSQSSRSHAILQILLRKRGAPKSKIHGKFSLIDLAGNERGVDTSSSDRQTRMEGAEINKSLLALKECIRALGRRNAHLPFRVSKLTLVLRDSFVGENSRTCMIAMVSPGLASCEHTLNTLRYADRVKELGANPDAGAKGSIPYDDYAMEQNSRNDSDLALLHTHNVNELPDDLYNYQMGITQLQELEDQIVEDHQRLVEDGKVWVKRDDILVHQAAGVDYDVDKYAEELDRFLGERIERLSKLQTEVQEWRKLLANEEQVARTMTSSTNGRRK